MMRTGEKCTPYTYYNVYFVYVVLKADSIIDVRIRPPEHTEILSFI